MWSLQKRHESERKSPSPYQRPDQKCPFEDVTIILLPFRTDPFDWLSGLWIIISVPDLLPSGAAVVLSLQHKQTVNLGPRQLSAASSSKLKWGNHDVLWADMSWVRDVDSRWALTVTPTPPPPLTFTAPVNSQSKLASCALWLVFSHRG